MTLVERMVALKPATEGHAVLFSSRIINLTINSGLITANMVLMKRTCCCIVLRARYQTWGLGSVFAVFAAIKIALIANAFSSVHSLLVQLNFQNHGATFNDLNGD